MERILTPKVRQYSIPRRSSTSRSSPSIISGNKIMQSSHMIFQL